MLRLERTTLEDLWQAIEDHASSWRSTDDLADHLHRWLLEHEGRDDVTARTGQAGRYLAFGHGGLVRRPVNGDWSGQGAPEYRTLPPAVDATIADAIELHLRRHGPSSRHDVAWWSGLGLRVVDQHLTELGERLALVLRRARTGGRTSTCPTRRRRARWRAYGCCRSSTR